MVWAIGLSHSIFWNYSLEEALEICSRIGVELLEIWADHPAVYPAIDDAPYISKIRDVLASYDISVTVHASCHDVNIASINPGIRKESVRQMLGSARLAHELGSEIVVVHPGRRTTRYINDSTYIAYAVKSLKIVAGEAQDYGVTICVENMENNPRQFAVKPEVILSIVREVDHPNVKITFDVAHANTYIDPIEYFRRIREYVAHVHLSNNFGQKTPRVHMPLYKGSIDMYTLLRTFYEYGYRGRLVIEGGSYENTVESVAKNVDYLRVVIKELLKDEQ